MKKLSWQGAYYGCLARGEKESTQFLRTGFLGHGWQLPRFKKKEKEVVMQPGGKTIRKMGGHLVNKKAF